MQRIDSAWILGVLCTMGTGCVVSEPLGDSDGGGPSTGSGSGGETAPVFPIDAGGEPPTSTGTGGTTGSWEGPCTGGAYWRDGSSGTSGTTGSWGSCTVDGGNSLPVDAATTRDAGHQFVDAATARDATADSAAPQDCQCDDSDICTRDSCDSAGYCVYQALSAADAPDDDGDGYPEGCDCDDADAEVHPEQTGGFSDPRDTPSGSTYDYDCDGQPSPVFNNRAMPCEPAPETLGCLGSGWDLPANAEIPGCAEDGAFQVCERSGDGCMAQITMLAQRCR